MVTSVGEENELVKVKKQLSILVVDDKEIDLFIATKVIAHSGLSCKLFTAPTTFKGLNILEKFYRKEQRYPDVIFTEFYMPLLDGAAFIAKIKALEHFSEKDTKIWVLTGCLSRQNLVRLKKIGVNGIASKPLGNEILFNVLLEKKYKSIF